MNNKSPNIIFKCKFLLALKHHDNKINNINYVKNRNSDVNNMFDYYSNPKESIFNMFDYYNGNLTGNNYNLVLENGKYATKEDIARKKIQYKKYIENSNLWKGIISFNNSYLDENISLKDLEQKFAKNIMPNFLKYCGFDNPKNIDYVFAIHTQSKSKHIHIHFSFIEKKPSYKYSHGISYRKLGKITVDERNYLKKLIALTIEREKYYTPLLVKTNTDIDELKTYFKPSEKNFLLENGEDILFEEKILKLGSLLKQYRILNNNSAKKVKYNSLMNNDLGKQIKCLTKEIKHYLFKDEASLLYDKKKCVDEDLENLNNYFNDLENNLHIKEKLYPTKISDIKRNYIDNYVYNSIVNHSLYKYEHISSIVKSKKQQDTITIEDLIQELAYQNSMKWKNYNDKERRKQILNNYFKETDNAFQFPNKYKMEKALKNINYEMEKASQEFSKLFNYNDNDK